MSEPVKPPGADRLVSRDDVRPHRRRWCGKCSGTGMRGERLCQCAVRGFVRANAERIIQDDAGDVWWREFEQPAQD